MAEKSVGVLPGSNPAHPPPDFTYGAEAIVEAWLARLPAVEAGAERSPDLLECYRALGTSVLRFALRRETRVPPTTMERLREGLPALDRLLATVTAANRRSGVGTAQTVEDLGRLAPAAIRWFEHELDEVEDPGGTADFLAATESVVICLGLVVSRLARLLEATARRAQREQSEGLAAMVDMLSHELRNRLGAAGTASQMLLDPSVQLTERHLERAAGLVRMSVDDALKTVDDVHRLAATRAERTVRSVRPSDLADVLRGVVNELRPAAKNAGVELLVDDELVSGLVDASRLRLILFNLIGNGIKYHDESEKRPRVWVEAERGDGGSVVIRVRDNGVGIPPDQLEDVFLYRVRGAAAGDTAGSGLGLAIAREAAEQIGGDITVTSRPGEGSTFRLVFGPLGESGSV